MVTTPLRAAAGAGTWRTFWPQIMSLTLSAALVSFFTQYVSAFDHPMGVDIYLNPSINEGQQAQDLAAILITNLVLLAGALYALERWKKPPVGMFTVLFGGVAFAMTGLAAYNFGYLVAPALVAGIVADVAYSRVPRVVLAAIVPAVLWSGYFAVVHAFEGLNWTPELWAGAVVLTIASGALLAALNATRRPSLGRGPVGTS
jgi:hypothetical protein